MQEQPTPDQIRWAKIDILGHLQMIEKVLRMNPPDRETQIHDLLNKIRLLRDEYGIAQGTEAFDDD